MISGPHEPGLPAALDASPPGGKAPHFPLRIAIIHGNRMSGELLRAHCAQAWGCEVVAGETSAPDCVSPVRNTQPDVVLLGHGLPLVNCIELLPSLQEAAPAAKFVVLTAQLSEYLVYRLSTLHPHAVIEESSEGLDAVSFAITRLRDGGRWYSPRFLHLAARLRSRVGTFPMLLSMRQEQVLACIAHTMSDHEISASLSMSAATAKRHRADIADKLNLRGTQQQLIRYGIDKGFASIPPPVHRKRAENETTPVP
jgi:DNA-binding NarL/FixJ family response regulator